MNRDYHIYMVVRLSTTCILTAFVFHAMCRGAGFAWGWEVNLLSVVISLISSILRIRGGERLDGSGVLFTGIKTAVVSSAIVIVGVLIAGNMMMC